MLDSPKSDEAGSFVCGQSWAKFQDAMEAQGVPDKNRTHYERWVKTWLGSEVEALPAQEPAQTFASFLERNGLPDWQCRQAYQAIRIWTSLPEPEPAVVSSEWAVVLERFARNLAEQHYSPRTIASYADWGRRWALRSPSVPKDGEAASAQVQEFLRFLVHELNLSPASLSLARNALAWLVKRVLGFELALEDKGNAHHARRLPTVLAPSTVRALLSGCSDPWDLFFGLQYGCGMRLAELLELRVQEIGMERGVLMVRSGKGDKDRQIPLPSSLKERLGQHLERRRAQWRSDLGKGYARVDLPYAMGRKLTGAETSWEWQHVFGAGRPLRHPESGDLRRWHPMQETARSALKAAALGAGIEGRVHPHLLRHCYATHMLEAGVPVREIQDLMGHSRLETTMVYMHVRSPSAVRPAVDLLQTAS
jgi:integron integrase